MTNRENFGAETTTDEVLDGIDLVGKLVLVTGGTSGLGEETARAMAAKGAHVILTGRNMPKAEAVVAKIKESTGNANVEAMEVELDSLASIHKFADAFLSKHKKLDILVNNAGVMACPFSKTQDGFEMQFGTNHVGHFLLTNLIAPALVAAAPSRIVNLSSRGHHFAPTDLEDPMFETREYNKWIAYGNSKTANILFSVGLEKRLGSKGVHAYAVHPGVIMTELSRHMDEEDFERLQAQTPNAPITMKSVEAGAATSCYSATAPELEGKGGIYLEDCHIAEEMTDTTVRRGVRPYALDPESAEKLWALSEKLVGQSFSY